MRVSVIIPAYNAAQTIRTTLDTLAGQAGEIIVVDDGSTDGTAELVAGEYPDVVLLRQENRGVSAARNSGMAVATGDYIAFVDADDVLFPDAVKSAGAGMDGIRPDLVILRSFTGDVEQYPWKRHFKTGRTYGKQDIIDQGFIRGSVWGCLFRRSFLEGHHLAFPDGISMAEDQLFLNAVIAHGASIRFLDIRFYEFRVLPGSLSRQYDDNYFHRLSAALFTAPRMIPDEALRSHVQLSIVLGMTSVAVATGRPARWVMQATGLRQALPLSTRGMKKRVFAVRILNAGYPLLYSAVRLVRLFR